MKLQQDRITTCYSQIAELQCVIKKQTVKHTE
jgi:hypothetical protein